MKKIFFLVLVVNLLVVNSEYALSKDSPKEVYELYVKKIFNHSYKDAYDFLDKNAKDEFHITITTAFKLMGIPEEKINSVGMYKLFEAAMKSQTAKSITVVSEEIIDNIAVLEIYTVAPEGNITSKVVMKREKNVWRIHNSGFNTGR